MSDPPSTSSAVSHESHRTQWVAAVIALLDQIQSWARQSGWKVIRHESERSEESLGTYTVPTLEIHLGPRRLYVEPVARHVIGADGRVDILASPSLNHVMLIRSGDTWRVYSQDRELIDKSLSSERFSTLARELAEAA